MPRLVVILERLEKVRRRRVPVALRHVHLAATLADDPQDVRVRNRARHRERALIQLLQLLVVLLLREHLNLNRVHLKKLRAPRLVRPSVFVAAKRVQLAQNLRHVWELPHGEEHLAQLEVCLEPQPVVL